MALFNVCRGVQDIEAACPFTAALVRRIPGIVNVGFSVLRAGARTPKHRGFIKSVVRVHLGLVVKPYCCNMRIYNQRRKAEDRRGWGNGELLAFDDTQLHWVENVR